MTMPHTPDDLDAARASLLTLDPQKAAAVQALAAGATHAQAALTANVSRECVSRWATRHPGFMAALAEYRAMLAAVEADRIRSLRARALAIVDRDIDNADMATALQVLRALATSGVSATALPSAETILANTIATSPRPEPTPFGMKPLHEMIDELNGCDRGAAEADRVALLRLVEATATVPAD